MLIWIQTLSSIGVLVGLVVVILQLRQSEESLTAQLIANQVSTKSELINRTMGENIAESISKLNGKQEKMTDVDLYQLDALFTSLFTEIAISKLYGELGLYSADAWKRQVN